MLKVALCRVGRRIMHRSDGLLLFCIIMGLRCAGEFRCLPLFGIKGLTHNKRSKLRSFHLRQDRLVN